MSKEYQEQSAPHTNSEMPKAARGGEFSSDMKSVVTINPPMKKDISKKGGKDYGKPFETDNPKGSGKGKRSGGIGKNPAHGF